VVDKIKLLKNASVIDERPPGYPDELPAEKMIVGVIANVISGEKGPSTPLMRPS